MNSYQNASNEKKKNLIMLTSLIASEDLTFYSYSGNKELLSFFQYWGLNSGPIH
jgi:hypothetical protein